MTRPDAHAGDLQRISWGGDSPLIGGMYVGTRRVCYFTDVISREPGKGHLGRLLLQLQDGYDEIVCPNVISEIVAGMLARRGYHLERHYWPEADEYVDCWVWRRSTTA